MRLGALLFNGTYQKEKRISLSLSFIFLGRSMFRKKGSNSRDWSGTLEHGFLVVSLFRSISGVRTSLILSILFGSLKSLLGLLLLA